jgi:hypothetical protein
LLDGEYGAPAKVGLAWPGYDFFGMPGQTPCESLLQGGADVKYFPLAHKTRIAAHMSGIDYPCGETLGGRSSGIGVM